jgi:hypothetical protein
MINEYRIEVDVEGSCDVIWDTALSVAWRN